MTDDFQLPQAWSVQTIGSQGRIITGKTPSTKITDHFGGHIPFITPSDMDGRRIISYTARYLTDQGATSVSRARIPAGAVMVSCIGSDMGKTAIAGCDAVTNQQINSIVVREGISSIYVYYNLSTRQGEIQHLGSGGSAVPILNKGHFCQLHIALPPLKEQQAIACILGALDDKIELNRRMNQTLEAMARAIFKSWFVDFDPVRAKAAVRREHPRWTNEQVSRAACPNLRPDLAALFPDAFEDSELGEIPKGWPASNIGQHFRLTMGQSPPGSTYNETGEGLPFYQGRTDFGFRFPTRRVFCTAPTRFADPGDTLVSVRAPVGDVNMASERCAVGRGVAAICHNSGSQSVTYYSMHHLADHFAKFEAEGTVFGSINKKDFERLPFLAPPPGIVSALNRIVSPLDERIATSERQITVLANLRDALLPKLISGELRVPDAERIVGRAT